MIDLKQELQDFHTINLQDIYQGETDIPDNIRNSIFLYNKALETLLSGSEDIAIIELKKAISMNPRFYEAMNLLGICYSCAKDNVRAAETFEKVIKAEQNSVKALKYLSLLNSNDDGAARPKTKKKASDAAPRRRTVSGENTEKGQNKIERNKIVLKSWTRYLVFFAAGILLALAIQLIASRPVKDENYQANNNVTKNRYCGPGI